MIAALPVGVIPCAVQHAMLLRRHGIVKSAGACKDPGNAFGASGMTAGNYSNGFSMTAPFKLPAKPSRAAAPRERSAASKSLVQCRQRHDRKRLLLTFGMMPGIGIENLDDLNESGLLRDANAEHRDFCARHL